MTRDHSRTDTVGQDRAAFDAALAALGVRVKGNAAHCPWHDDHTPSATIIRGKIDGHWRLYCFPCNRRADVFDLRAQAGATTVNDQLRAASTDSSVPIITLSPPPQVEEKEDAATFYPSLEAISVVFQRIGKIEAIYPYGNAFRIFRIMPPGGKKTFRQASLTPGGWVATAPPKPWPLYNLASVSASDRVVVCEGEKCAEALIALGICATTSPCGAEKGKHADWSLLAGKVAVLWPDNDDAGFRHMADIQRILAALPNPPRMSLIKPGELGLKEKEDAFDFIASLDPKGAADAVEAALRQATPVAAPVSLLRTHADRVRDRMTPGPMIIDGLLPEGGIGAIVALPGIGKTLISTMLARCIASGDDFAGHKVAPGFVIYSCPDSPASTERRMLAIPEEIASRIFTITALEQIPDSIPALRQAIEQANASGQRVRLVVIDTWDSSREHSSGGYADQDGAAEVIMRSLRALAEELRLAIVVVHHATRADGGRARGTVVFDARCDWIGIAEAGGPGLMLRTQKARDGESGFVGSWSIVPVLVGERSVPVLVDADAAGAGLARKLTAGIEKGDAVLSAIQRLTDAGTTPTFALVIKEAGLSGTGTLSRVIGKLREQELVDLDDLILTEKGLGRLGVLGQ